MDCIYWLLNSIIFVAYGLILTLQNNLTRSIEIHLNDKKPEKKTVGSSECKNRRTEIT
jgi:hypothetical protein